MTPQRHPRPPSLLRHAAVLSAEAATMLAAEGSAAKLSDLTGQVKGRALGYAGRPGVLKRSAPPRVLPRRAAPQGSEG